MSSPQTGNKTDICVKYYIPGSNMGYSRSLYMSNVISMSSPGSNSKEMKYHYQVMDQTVS